MKREFYRNTNVIFADEGEQYIKNLVLYASADATHVTTDSKHKNKVDKDTLLELVLKGAVIKLDTAYYIPTKVEETSGYLTVTCAADGTTAKTFYSSEQA